MARTVKDKDLSTPPVSPSDGDAYIVASGNWGTGSSKAGQIAYWRTSAAVWQFIVPALGWTLRVADELDANSVPKEYGYTGSTWTLPAGTGGSFVGGTLSSALNEAPSVTLASSSTVSIGGASSNSVNISGTSTIIAFDVIPAGAKRTLIFQGILTLTHHATAQILPTGANITTAAGDTADFISLGSGNWRCTSYMRANGQALASSGGGGGSLAYLTEAKNVSAPNATIPAVSLSVSIAEANGDFALTPKGTGAILGQAPTNTAAGGNKRGTYATDLQRSRSANTQVASGNCSVLMGGDGNEVGGNYSVIGGGLGNWSPGGYGFIGSGDGNTNSSSYGVLGGGYRNSTGADGYATLGGGANNYASGSYTTITGGYYAATRGIYGAEAHASGRFGAQGDAQRERFIMRKATTDATSIAIAADGTAASSLNQVVMPDSSAYAFNGYVVARNNATGDCAKWLVDGLAKRGSGVATTAIVGTPTVTKSFSDSGASAWTLTATANTTLGCIAFTVTGVAATSIKWVADIQTVEVVG